MGLVHFIYTVPVIALFIFGVHQLLNARSLIDFLLPFPIGPSLCIVLQHQNLVYEWTSIFWTDKNTFTTNGGNNSLWNKTLKTRETNQRWTPHTLWQARWPAGLWGWRTPPTGCGSGGCWDSASGRGDPTGGALAPSHRPPSAKS